MGPSAETAKREVYAIGHGKLLLPRMLSEHIERGKCSHFYAIPWGEYLTAALTVYLAIRLSISEDDHPASTTAHPLVAHPTNQPGTAFVLFSCWCSDGCCLNYLGQQMNSFIMICWWSAYILIIESHLIILGLNTWMSQEKFRNSICSYYGE